ncbi:transposase [Nocardia pneumoniae]|uniref:transposase n=1 Tax=Nocardia pneumoniae TaxID=228601 RepID=UPI0035715E4B
MTRRAALTDSLWPRLKPLLPCPNNLGRPSEMEQRPPDRRIRWRIRVGVPWRDVPACYCSDQQVLRWLVHR